MLIVACHFEISCLSFFRFMDSDQYFSIFRLFLHIKRKDLSAETQVTVAKFDCPD